MAYTIVLMMNKRFLYVVETAPSISKREKEILNQLSQVLSPSDPIKKNTQYFFTSNGILEEKDFELENIVSIKVAPLGLDGDVEIPDHLAKHIEIKEEKR